MLRRRILSIAAALVLVAGLGAAATASPGRGPTWDGTWAGGWESGDGVQITFVGQKLIGFYKGDYRDLTSSQVSADGKTVDFAWQGGDATLRRTGEDEARMMLREHGRPERSFAIKRE